jgi:hypothetical protein
LTGCPHFAIWTADHALEQLRPRANFSYRSGFRVEAVRRSESGGLAVTGSGTGGQIEQLPASRVLLACGPLATARIVLHSIGMYERPVTLRYQPYFLLPMLASSATPGVEDEAMHTLAQVFVEIQTSDVSPYTVHLQVYSFNRLIDERLRSTLRILGPLSGVTRRALTRRLLAVQGYLHSAHGGGITMKARVEPHSRRVRLELRADAVPADIVQRVVRLLRRQQRRFGARPLSWLSQMGRPGEGNHCGGSFPMRQVPGPLETDTFGQLRELPAVHLVDSSVLPSLPATTFTYTVMANAHRIGRAVAQLSRA